MYARVHNHFFIAFILVLFKTPTLCWGFSFDQTKSYQQTAEIKKLSENPQWIKLGHYKNTWRGYRSGFRTGFFVDDNGYKSPAIELVATINLLYNDSAEFVTKHKVHPQCYYLARTQWLNQQLNISQVDRVHCTERDAWKKQLNVSSVSLIFAAGDFGNAASIFGHTFLKINNPNNQNTKELLDYGIDYSAESDASEGIFYAVKGLFGMYDGHFAMLPFHQKISDYANIEGRDLWEYHLNFTKEETEFLVNHLLEMENARAPYFFADDNCSTQILRTLEVVRPDANLADGIKNFVVPIDTVKLVAKSVHKPTEHSGTMDGSMVSRVQYRPSLKTEFQNSYKKLNSNQRMYFPMLLKTLNFQSSENKFDKTEKSELLDTAAAALAVEAFKKGINLEEKKYQLYLQRIELGPGKPVAPVAEPVSPTNTHDPVAVSFGALKNGYSFKWRSAFHELEMPHDGLIPHSHAEAISVSAKYSTQTNKLYFDRFTLLQIINLNPSNSLENNLSWKVRADIQDQFRPDLEAGAGASYAVTNADDVRFSSFISARHWYSGTQFTGVGPELLVSYHPWNQLGLSLSTTYFFVGLHDDFLRYKFRFNWQFAQQVGLKFQYENFIEKDFFTDSKDEFKSELSYNFIF